MALIQEVRIAGLDDLRKRVQRMKLNAKDLRAPSKLAGEEMIVRTQDRMAKGLDIHGRPFKKSRRSSVLGRPTLGGSDRSMANSAHYAVAGNGLDWYSTHIGAAVHQEGKTIKPKNRKWLTIPLRAIGGNNETAGLSMKANRSGKRALDFKGTFFLRSRGRLFLMQKLDGKKLRALFLLVKSMTMKKNEWFGFTAGDEGAVGEIYLDHLDTFGDKR